MFILRLICFFHNSVYFNAHKITEFSAENLVLPYTKCLTWMKKEVMWLQFHSPVFPLRWYRSVYPLLQLLKLLIEPFPNRSQVNRKDKPAIVREHFVCNWTAPQSRWLSLVPWWGQCRFSPCCRSRRTALWMYFLPYSFFKFKIKYQWVMPCKPTEAIRRKIQHGVSKTTFHGVMI